MTLDYPEVIQSQLFNIYKNKYELIGTLDLSGQEAVKEALSEYQLGSTVTHTPSLSYLH